jgi:hypothetical protein
VSGFVISKRPIRRGSAGRYPAGTSKSDLSRTASENSINITLVVIGCSCSPRRRFVSSIGKPRRPAPRNSTCMRSGASPERTTEPVTKECSSPAFQHPAGGRSICQPSSTDSLGRVCAPGLGSVAIDEVGCWILGSGQQADTGVWTHPSSWTVLQNGDGPRWPAAIPSDRLRNGDPISVLIGFSRQKRKASPSI